MEDSPKSNIGCGLIVLIPGLIVWGIIATLHLEQEGWVVWAIVLTSILGVIGLIIIVVNGLILAFG